MNRVVYLLQERSFSHRRPSVHGGEDRDRITTGVARVIRRVCNIPEQYFQRDRETAGGMHNNIIHRRMWVANDRGLGGTVVSVTENSRNQEG